MTTVQPGDIKFLDRNLPNLSEAEARRFALEWYGLAGEFTPLQSERDQNYRISAADGSAVVLKIANVDEDFGVLDFQTKALMHIAERDASLPVPRVICNRHGEAISRFAASNGAQHHAHVLSYLPGRLLCDVEFDPRLLRKIGAMLARLDLALRDFFHPHAGHEIVWDLKRCLQLRPHTRHIHDEVARTNVESIFDRMEQRVIPKLKSLRHQVIHADAHNLNLLIHPERPGELAGLLDFGDMHYAPLAMEIAVAADFDYLPVERWLDALCALTRGYDQVLPLEEAEIDLLYDLVLCRLAMVATVIAWRNQLATAETAYFPDSPGLAIIAHVLALGGEQVRDRLRRACRFPVYCPIGETDGHEIGDELDALVQRRHAVLGKQLGHFYKTPLHIERGRGVWLYDRQGRVYLDAYNNVPVVGHCHPRVVNAVARQMAALNTNTRYVYRSILEYAEQLTATLPAPLSACLFVNSGSEANDVAWQIAKFASGNCGGIVMEHAYHGISDAVHQLSPYEPGKTVATHVATLISPDTYRGPFRKGHVDVAGLYARDADRAVAELEAKGFGVAALLLDSTFMSNGIPDVPAGYARAVADTVRANGGLVIADEVQAGFGRMGQMWGFGVQGFSPDIVTLGKPVGNGYPLGVVITTPAILDAFIAATGLFSTFGGNPVACAAGLAVLDVIEDEGLVQNARETGEYLRQGVRALANEFPLIGDVRGQGLVVGIEFVSNRETLEPAADANRQLVESMRENGVLVGSEGPLGNVMKIRPPLVFGRHEADLLVAALHTALRQLRGDRTGTRYMLFWDRCWHTLQPGEQPPIDVRR